MLIKSAMAAAEQAIGATSAPAAVPAPGMVGAFPQTIVFTVVLIALFYLLLIRPQQKRYKDHADMLGKLGVNDRIVTQGGMVGTISALPNDKEALVDFGNGTKMTVVRSSIMGKYDSADATKKKDKK